MDQKVVGSIPGQGTCLGCGFEIPLECVLEATNQCFFLSPPSSLSKIDRHIFKKYVYGLSSMDQESRHQGHGREECHNSSAMKITFQCRGRPSKEANISRISA